MLIEVMPPAHDYDEHSIPISDVRRMLIEIPCYCRVGVTNIVTGKRVLCRRCMFRAQLEEIRDDGLLELELGSS
jgi:hypothetical protein